MPLQPRSDRTCGPAFRPGAAALALLACWTAVSPGPTGTDPAPGLETVEKVRLVLLPTTVTDRSGKPVRGLQPSDFRLYESGTPRSIDLFATEEHAPVALAFLLDLSGSMKLQDRLGEAKRAVRFLVDALVANDRAGLIGFADDRVEWIAGFDQPRAEFLRRLNAQQAAGTTALYDALAASPHLVDEEIQGRKAIVLITDGLDNASTLPRLRATWMARRVAVPIYTLSFIPMQHGLLPRRAREALRVLERFSSETGGTLFTIHAQGDLDRAAERIRRELRFQYVIGFYPTEKNLDGTFRALKLEAQRDRLRVRTRSGYYADP